MVVGKSEVGGDRSHEVCWDLTEDWDEVAFVLLDDGANIGE